MRTRTYLLASAVTAALLASQASQAFVTVGVSINVAPPALPVYVQPAMPSDGYIWQPGYWAYDQDGGYYWVPGTWVEPPQAGYLWTPGYWGWNNGLYVWNEGYWGPTVGFYGGINYGFGYGGVGFAGGEWRGDHFFYNRAYNNMGNVHVTNVYNRTVVNNITINNHVSFNGGSGGVQARPRPEELAAEHQPHLQPVAAQMHQEELARANPDLRANVNHGRPAIAATARAADFSGHGVVAARGAPPLNHAQTLGEHANTPAVHANAAPERGNNPAGEHTNFGRQDNNVPAQHAAVQPAHNTVPRTDERATAATPRPQVVHNEATHSQAAPERTTAPVRTEAAPVVHNEARPSAPHNTVASAPRATPQQMAHGPSPGGHPGGGGGEPHHGAPGGGGGGGHDDHDKR